MRMRRIYIQVLGVIQTAGMPYVYIVIPNDGLRLYKWTQLATFA